MKLAFQIATRFLKSSKGQTILIALGIAIGVSVQIFIGSLIQGLQKSLVDTTIGNQPQITLTSNNEEKLIADYDEIVERISENEEEVINLSVAADGPALISKDDETYSILLRGFNIEDADKIFNIKESLVDGTLPENEGEVLIGVDLKEEAGISIGDEIELLANFGDTATVTVTGFFNLGVASLNKSWTITNLETAQNIFSYDDQVTSINMQLKDVFLADTVADSINERETSETLVVDNWKAQNEELLSGLNGQSVSSIMIQVFVMISVLLGIASILAITVVQKSKQIGILKAMGIKDKDSSLIFLFQGLLLGVLGAILGVALGLLLAFTFTKFALNPDGTPVVPLFIDPIFITFSAVIAVAASVIAALIPARTSSKLSPIEVIRNA
ncbi:ABC transporter permease [Proteiniclasticum ruminis]|uniref:Lipoprotein-releasing system permease protein n=1 Tax=Proteiniclasticum ruminis TaxID=398199 RepID=A0A1I5ATU4_9CLOT|nr:FtsX-like permease family protein [Proteiniclasticum ruminis]SFN65878.1 lipoprotein-releasing system permease protein [Proteiniclasticum ruminis]